MLDTGYSYACSGLKSFAFSRGVETAAQKVLARDAGMILHELLRDQETEAALYAAKQVLDWRLAFAPEHLQQITDCAGPGCNAAALLDWLTAMGAALHDRIRTAMGTAVRARRAVLRERAAIGLVANCWCDTVSQPATQPGRAVNVLYGHHFRWLGEGVIEKAVPELRRRAMNEAGVILPALIERSFAEKAMPTTSTALAAAWMVALSRYPANYLPEVLGAHIAYHAIGLDAALFGVETPFGEDDLAALMETYLAEIDGHPDAPQLVGRILNAVALIADMEAQQSALLAEVAEKTLAQNLDSRVAELVARHAPMAGSHHREVKVGGAPMSETFASPDVPMQDFMEKFRKSFYLRNDKEGGCRFTRSLKFGGPMFGIFTAEEAQTFKDWADEIAETRDAPVVLMSARPDDPQGADDLTTLRAARPRDAVLSPPPPANDRELFFRLVNVENFPSALPFARERAQQGLAVSRGLFDSGAAGRYTDGSFFAYTPQALLDRVDAIYWKKLVGPYKPLETIPDRDTVIFEQKTYALGNLIDGSWSYRIANAGRYDRTSDGKLFAISADEMGLGEVEKNHITLICDVLRSMDIHLPHIADPAFLDQAELPDEVYGFAINQLALALFPDSHYPEIVGYNLAIEMFGLGELRLHEIQKLRHWGMNPIYEEAHLSIDNASSGHARQSAEIVNDYLDDVRRKFGEARMHEEWARVLNGYCSFARFVEIGTIDLDEAPGQQPGKRAVLESLEI
ncbi:MAG: iron-containing redox enzyme family protein [Paracoccaceae bacterium]